MNISAINPTCSQYINLSENKNHSKPSFGTYTPSVKNKEFIYKCVDMIKSPDIKDIIIATHKGPDGDAVGSLIALKRIIEKATGKIPRAVLSYPLNERFKFITLNNNEIEINPNFEQMRPDLLITTDIAEKVLFDYGTDDLLRKAKHSIKIDHHPEELTPEKIKSYRFADINLVDDSKESASQLVMEFVDAFGLKPDKNISDPIAMGLITDSGNFKFVKNSGLFFDAGLLAETSNMGKISDDVNKVSFEYFKELISILHDKVKYFNGVKFAYFTTPEQKTGLNAKDLNTSVFESLRTIRNLDFCFSLRKDPKMNKISSSIRSTEKPVLEKIRELGGGGHNMACGLSLNNVSENEAAKIIIDKLSEIK